MVEKATLKTVKVSVNGKTEEIKVEQGVSFENKGSIYTLDENSKLKRCDKTTNLWEEASEIKMTNYQWKAFQNVANNDGDAKSYTKADIEKAMELYGNGEFKADMSEDLPSGYRIEKPAKFTNDKLVQAYVTNGKESQSATLKFKIENVDEAESVEEVQEVQEEQEVETAADVEQQEALIGADEALVKEYSEKFKNMSSSEIAECLYKQIKNMSNNTKTLSMFDAIPNEKLVGVVRDYNLRYDGTPLGVEIGNEIMCNLFGRKAIDRYRKNLFHALKDENGMDIKCVIARINKFANQLEVDYPQAHDLANKIKDLVKDGCSNKTIYHVEDVIEYSLKHCRVDQSRINEYKKEGDDYKRLTEYSYMYNLNSEGKRNKKYKFETAE